MTFKAGDKVLAVLHGPGLAVYTGEGEVQEQLAVSHPTYIVRFAAGIVEVREEWLEPVNPKPAVKHAGPLIGKPNEPERVKEPAFKPEPAKPGKK